jgi:hypothetical protein
MHSLSKVLGLSLLAVMLSFCPASSCQIFTNPIRVATPVDPNTVVAGDLNGDGRVDLIWFQVTSTNSIGHVLLRQTNGGYLAGLDITIPGVPSGVPMCATADVTRDGRLDLICVTLSTTTAIATVFVFPGNGDGSFGTFVSTQVGGQYGQGIILTLAGDLNRDGIPDFILQDDYYTPALVLLSNGSGGFLPTKTVPNSYNYGGPVSADINGDGILDILWPEGAGVALGKGDGSFGNLLTPYSPGYANAPITCAFHDLDGDGKIDALCGYLANGNGAGTAFDILHGNGDGTFNPTPIAHQVFGSSSVNRSGSGDFLTPDLIRDVNGDGIPDVLAFSGDGMAVLLGQPGLTFGAPAHYAQAFSGYGLSARISAQEEYTDLNGDGLIDVLAAGPNGLYLTYGHADGTFGSAVVTKVSEENGRISVSDFNGDGKPDIVSTGAPVTSLSFGKGDGGFAAPVPLPGSPFATGSPLYVADFNGDGKQDILSTDSSYAYHLMLGNGDGTFAPAITTTGLAAARSSTSSTDNYTPPYGLTGDLNSDGKADLFSLTFASTSSTYSLVSALSNGDGTFHSVTTNYTAPAYNSAFYFTPIAPALGDFAHRGKLDAVYFLNQNVYVVQGNGDGSFSTTPTVLAIPVVAGVQANWLQAIQAADLDGDGNLDIVFLSWFEPGLYYSYQGGPSCVLVYYGKGDGTFGPATQAGCFTHAYTDLRVADFNGDGRPDIVLQTASTLNNYVVGLIDNQGGRAFGSELNYTAGSLSGDLFVSDLNLDGRPDLVFGNQRYEAGYSANSVTVLLNESSAVVTGTLTSAPNPSYIGQPFSLTATLIPPSPSTLYAGAITFYVDGTVIGSAPLSSNAATIAGPTTLTSGTHQISATWPGDISDPSLTLNASHTVLQYPLQIALTCAPNPSTLGQAVMLSTVFTATPPAGVPASSAPYTGTLSFSDGSTVLEQQQVPTAGYSFMTSSLSSGSHTLTATYSGDIAYANSTASCTETVNKLPTTTQLSLNPIPSASNSFQLVAKIAPATATALSPSGTVDFTVDGAYAGTGAVDPATGIASYNDAGVTGGNHIFGCSYGGDANFAGSVCPSDSAKTAPAPDTLTLISSVNPAAAGSSITFTANLSTNNKPAAGEVVVFTLSANGVTQAQGFATTDANGNAVYRSAGLAPGSYTVSALFAGDNNLQNAFSPTLIQLVVINPTATSLTASPNPGYAGNSVILTTTVTATGTSNSVPPSPSGTVTFLDRATILGTAALNGSGTATLTTTSLVVGVHSLTATYQASPLFLGSHLRRAQRRSWPAPSPSASHPTQLPSRLASRVRPISIWRALASLPGHSNSPTARCRRTLQPRSILQW